MRLIDADALKNHYSWWEGGTKENTLDEQKKIFDTIVNLQPTIIPAKNGMTHEKEVKWLDEIESALVRAETARKDLDIILLMRFVRDYLESEVKNGTVQKD